MYCKVILSSLTVRKVGTVFVLSTSEILYPDFDLSSKTGRVCDELEELRGNL